MIQVNVHEAKTNLSRLLIRVSCGEEVLIAKSGNPIARLIPYNKPKSQRKPGLDTGLVKIIGDFDAPLNDELLKEFEH